MLTAFRGIATVFTIGTAGYLAVAGFGPSPALHNLLSKLVIRVAVPCLVVHGMVTTFDVQATPLWWVYPLMAVAVNVTGILAGLAYTSIDRTVKHPRQFAVLTGFQNAMFLPLAFAPLFFGGAQLSGFLNILFLYQLLSVPTFFTLALWLVRSSSLRTFSLRTAVNTPVIATITAFVLAVSGLGLFVPAWILEPVGSVGRLATPLSMIFVGGIIVTTLPQAGKADLKDILKVTLVKCLAYPALVTVFVWVVRPPVLTGYLLLLQATMPSALMIALIAPDEEESQRFIAGSILVTHLACIVTIPVFTGIFSVIYGNAVW